MQWLIPPVLWALCLLGMAAQKLVLPLFVLLPPPLHLVGLAPVAAGLAIMIYAAAQFHRRETNIRPFRKPDLLVDDGMYRFTRNPMYLGFASTLLGAALLFDDPGAFVFVAVFVVVADRWYIPHEERLAQEVFGAEYEAYRRRVRRWL